MPTKGKTTSTAVEVNEIIMAESRFNVLGVSPMIMNRFSQKAWQELLFPSARRSRATLESALKHDPIAEFRGALYRNRDPKQPALFHIPNGAFHQVLCNAGIDIPGAAKAKLERLTSVVETQVNVFGVPQLFMSMVRNSDMNRTPDVRTRPVFPEWACTVTIRYVKSLVTEKTIANLFGASGVIGGIGDWRPQKGGSFGAFRVVDDNDATFSAIVNKQGRAAQQKAYDHPIFFDQDTEELMAWFEDELRLREKEAPSSHKASRNAKAASRGANGKAPPKTRRGVVTEGRTGNVLNA